MDDGQVRLKICMFLVFPVAPLICIVSDIGHRKVLLEHGIVFHPEALPVKRSVPFCT